MKTIKFCVLPGQAPVRIAKTDGRIILIGEEPRPIPGDLHADAWAAGAMTEAELEELLERLGARPRESPEGHQDARAQGGIARQETVECLPANPPSGPKPQAEVRRKRTTKGWTFSSLQKSILRLAYEGDGSVSPAAVKTTYYGFPLQPRGKKLLFDRAEIGTERYRNASVAINQAFGHLVRKGLAVKERSELRLTEEGLRLAETMNIRLSATRA